MLHNYFFANTQQKLFLSTLFRMFYLSQPIAGLLLLTSQLFSGRDNYLSSFVPARRYKFSLIIFNEHLYIYCASVMCRRFSNSATNANARTLTAMQPRRMFQHLFFNSFSGTVYNFFGHSFIINVNICTKPGMTSSL